MAHHPALDWMTDEGKRALFPMEQIGGDGEEEDDGGTGGYEETDDGREEEKKSDGYDCEERGVGKGLHDMDLLIFFCEQWVETVRFLVSVFNFLKKQVRSAFCHNLTHLFSNRINLTMTFPHTEMCSARFI